MDKKMLRSIPRPAARPEYFARARSCDKNIVFLAGAEADGDIFQIVLWNREQLLKGVENAQYRIFISDEENDYLTQDLNWLYKTKWLTGKLISVTGCFWVQWDGHVKIDFIDDRSKALIEEKYPPSLPDYYTYRYSAPSAWETFDNWQCQVMDRRLEERHYQELSHTREMMAKVPQYLPEDFDDWIDNFVLRNYRYLLYDAGTTRRMRYAYCTHCASHLQIDTKEHRLRNGETMECPHCGSTLQMRSLRRFHTFENGQRYAALIQRVDKGTLIARYFDVSIVFRRDELTKIPVSMTVDRHVREVARIFYTGRKSESFEYREYKQSRHTTWCPDGGYIDCGRAVLYTKGLRDTLAGTLYQYSGIEAYQEHEGNRPVYVWQYMKYYPDNHEFERMAKAGLTYLISCRVRAIYPYIHRDVMKALKSLTKEHLRILRDLNGGDSMVEFLAFMEKCQYPVSEKDLVSFLQMFGTQERLMTRLHKADVPVGRFVRWADKGISPRIRNRSNALGALAHDWIDYIDWCEELKYDMSDRYVQMPGDFGKAHNRVLKEYQAMKNERERRKNAAITRKIKAAAKKIEEKDLLEVKSRKFTIRLPQGVEDLKNEGKVLHHCVATYAERVAKGQTIILFVREISHPDTPFYTMEIRGGKVTQCRGSHNRDMTPEVKRFVAAFEKSFLEKTQKSAAEHEQVKERDG